MAKKVKTNAMRKLEQMSIEYKTYEYDINDGLIDGISVANKIGKELEVVHKTLVTVGTSKNFYVFVIPVQSELSIKKAAKATGEKSIEMINPKDLMKITGYIKGGCSPIGMKKDLPILLEKTSSTLNQIVFNAGKQGYQVEISTHHFIDNFNVKIEDLIN